MYVADDGIGVGGEREKERERESYKPAGAREYQAAGRPTDRPSLYL